MSVLMLIQCVLCVCILSVQGKRIILLDSWTLKVRQRFVGVYDNVCTHAYTVCTVCVYSVGPGQENNTARFMDSES